MTIHKERYRNAILFFCEKIPNLGRTKLNKLLYFLDFDHFEKYERSVTGDIYENDELGPVPSNIEEILVEMEAEKLIETRIEPVFNYVRYHLIPLSHHNPRVFKSNEMEILCGVADKWVNHTAREMVIASHGEAPWIATRKGEVIPYALAYYRGKFEQPSYDEELREDKFTVVSDTQDF